MPESLSLYGLLFAACVLLVILVSVNVCYFVIRALLWRAEIERRLMVVEDDVGALNAEWSEAGAQLSEPALWRSGHRVPVKEDGA